MRVRITTLLLALAVVAAAAETGWAEKGRKKKKDRDEDPYAEYVWPAPPDEPRIKLDAVITGRSDVEAKSKLRRALLGASGDNPYEKLNKPFAAAFDSQGRLLVTDSGLGALLRFDREGEVMDVFGTKGAVRLKVPLGIGMGPGDVAYVADVGVTKVLAFDPEGKLRAVYGRAGELINPTDAALSPDGERLWVSDSKAHALVIFDAAGAERITTIGNRGEGEGEFNFPSALSFGPEGNVFVVDQLNTRVQVLDPNGEYLDEFGALGVGFGNFVRPKDVAVDEVGFIYVTDNAFNNVQIFDADFSLLTFVGEGGTDPGRFNGASGIAIRGEEFAVVEQLNQRVQVFRFLVSKTGE